ELLDPNSGSARHEPDVVFVARLLEDVCPPLVHDFLSLGSDAKRESVESVLAQTERSLKGFRERSGAALGVHNFALPARPVPGLFEPMAEGSQTDVIRTLNAGLARIARGIPGTSVLDFDRLTAELGYRDAYDEKLWYLGRSPLSSHALPRLAETCAAFLPALELPPRQCLVLDLAHTLWGGVVGEEVVAGIRLGRSYPGNVYRDFQSKVRELGRRGVLLAINSKNNREDVEEVFHKHPDMVLRLEDFASVRINWRDKVENMGEIADELNIGMDSLVFFDDNPAEQDRIQRALPEVMTLRGPREPDEYARILADSRAFERLSWTEEDRRRTEMYREQGARHEFARSAGSIDEFLRGLEMTASVTPVGEWAFPRV